ncbi:hypothetical protein NQ318_015725 [Aromia moschata]|uniref:Uncharacterized protein n=1 Tax=Aromia moschata TaxID=1265417 RepID=A0AAV8XZK7_9CUCU|nr:hypothetical protein NQ318_015725 [Aromia moschata]
MTGGDGEVEATNSNQEFRVLDRVSSQYKPQFIIAGVKTLEDLCKRLRAKNSSPSPFPFLFQSQMASEVRPSMKKRIITPEESLTRQLTVLKKAQ